MISQERLFKADALQNCRTGLSTPHLLMLCLSKDFHLDFRPFDFKIRWRQSVSINDEWYIVSHKLSVLPKYTHALAVLPNNTKLVGKDTSFKKAMKTLNWSRTTLKSKTCFWLSLEEESAYMATTNLLDLKLHLVTVFQWYSYTSNDDVLLISVVKNKLRVQTEMYLFVQSSDSIMLKIICRTQKCWIECSRTK